jgi:hypothetical protein
VEEKTPVKDYQINQGKSKNYHHPRQEPTFTKTKDSFSLNLLLLYLSTGTKPA